MGVELLVLELLLATLGLVEEELGVLFNVEGLWEATSNTADGYLWLVVAFFDLGLLNLLLRLSPDWQGSGFNVDGWFKMSSRHFRRFFGLVKSFFF